MGFKPIAALGRVDPDAFTGAVIHGNEDAGVPFVNRDGAGHIGPPHLVRIFGGDGPVVCFGTVGMTGSLWGLKVVLFHETTDAGI